MVTKANFLITINAAFWNAGDHKLVDSEIITRALVSDVNQQMYMN